MKLISLFALTILLSITSACRKAPMENLETPDWSEYTHGNTTSPDYNMVFKQDEIIRIDIVISADDWSIMQTDLAANLTGGGGPPGMISDFDPVWVPSSLFYNGIEWYQVGIRYKGNSSLSSSYQQGIKKLSFKLDFDQFEDTYPAIKNQRFYGFKQLSLKNNYDDLSLIRERVGSDLFRQFGLASPKVTFCALYVDFGSGLQYFGLYSMVEEVDDTVLESQFGSETGNLYKPDGPAASFAQGRYNEDEMEKKNNEASGDYTDVQGLYSVINNDNRVTDPTQWKADLEGIFQTDIFLKWLAANTVMQNWDTYGKMTHNYFLYNNPSTNQLTWIPWDNNEALQEGKMGSALSLSLDEVGNTWPLIRYLLDDATYNQKYREYMLQFIQEVFIPNEMIPVYSAYYSLLKEAVYAEEPYYTFLHSDAGFDQAIEALKTHVQQRNDAVQAYLNQK